MAKCPKCQADYPENTVFCDECGIDLLEDTEKITDPLDTTELTWIEGEEAKVPEEEVTSPLGLRLTILGSRHDVEVPLTKEVNIGRLDSASGSFPDVDLTDYGGGEKGVSRLHAKITKRGREVLIEDLGSMNGTFLNGRKLTPHLPEVLRNGYKLRLGKLMMWVSFTK
jgi:pSer/pThr/pTyr-binding forkhead associated (FHA) protein